MSGEGGLTAKEAAERRGCSVAWIKRLAQQGRIPGARKFGNVWVIPEDWAVGPRTNEVPTRTDLVLDHP